MSQKDSRDDSKGPPSTQKLNYLHSHFERGDSQHKNIPINTSSKPPYRAFEIFHLKLYVYIIDQARGQDGWILAEFSFCVFMDRDEVEVHKNVKRERGQYSAILTELAWSIKDLLYGTKSTEKK